MLDSPRVQKYCSLGVKSERIIQREGVNILGGDGDRGAGIERV